MDVQKLDGALAAALSENADSSARLPVFVRVQPRLAEEARRMLQAFGIEEVGDDIVIPAELDARQVAELSNQNWVVSIRGARRARMLG